MFGDGAQQPGCKLQALRGNTSSFTESTDDHSDGRQLAVDFDGC